MGAQNALWLTAQVLLTQRRRAAIEDPCYPAPSLKSLDQDGRVIYVGSFSKSLFPGLRLGYLVGPAAFIREARALRASVFRHPPGHIQRTVSYFLSLGHYDALVRRMGKTYHQRRQAVDDAMQGTALTMAGKGAYGGSSVWVRAPDGVDTLSFVSIAFSAEAATTYLLPKLRPKVSITFFWIYSEL